MTLLPNYAVELSAAGDRLAKRRVASRRRIHLTAIVVASLVVLGAMTAAAATLWNPQLGDDRRGHPVGSASAPPADQLKLFGALRRDATDDDHGEQVRYALSMFSPKGITGIRTDYVRLLGTHDGGLGVVLVPAVRAGDKRDVLCLWMRDPVDGGGFSCYTTADILSGNGFVGMSKAPAPSDPDFKMIPGPKGSKFKRVPSPTSRTMTIVGLVPDNVSRVRWDNAEAVVKNNYFTITGSGSRLKSGAPAIEWLDKDGRPVTQGSGSATG